MIRLTLLMLVVAFFSAYAWKNWFVSLCVAILLVAVVEHPDFPKSISNIPGLNPWNFLIFNVALAWFTKRSADGFIWDLPPIAARFGFGFFAVLILGVSRLLTNDFPEPDFTVSNIVSEYLINSVKWVVPAIILFDACRTRSRTAIALGVIIALYFLLAVQVVRWMPLGEVGGGGGGMATRASKITQNEIGYNRVTLSMMLAGASWSCLAAMPLLRTNFHRMLLFGVACAIILGQALTGGRTGYVTWAAIGVVLATMRWRKLLLILPVAVIVIFSAVPSVRDRMFQGFGGQQGNFTVQTSEYEMTSGRDIAWPVVIDEIGKAPFLGNGRQAMITTGTRDYLWKNFGESFPHPHQAYLEQLLDNGFLGFVCFMPIYFYGWFKSIPLVLERRDPLVCAIGCAGFCLISALLIGAMGGQTFYPRESSVGMWAAIGLMLRVSIQRQNAQYEGKPLFPDHLPEKYFIPGEYDEVESFVH